MCGRVVQGSAHGQQGVVRRYRHVASRSMFICIIMRSPSRDELELGCEGGACRCQECAGYVPQLHLPEYHNYNWPRLPRARNAGLHKPVIPSNISHPPGCPSCPALDKGRLRGPQVAHLRRRGRVATLQGGDPAVEQQVAGLNAEQASIKAVRLQCWGYAVDIYVHIVYCTRCAPHASRSMRAPATRDQACHGINSNARAKAAALREHKARRFGHMFLIGSYPRYGASIFTQAAYGTALVSRRASTKREIFWHTVPKAVTFCILRCVQYDVQAACALLRLTTSAYWGSSVELV